MDEGLNTFINSISVEDFNKGEYKSKRPSDMQRMADMLTNAELEPIMTAPDGMKESNLGLLAYEKTILRFDYAPRTSIRQGSFDKAFRVYTERWALNIPHQMIF
jgi:hypothetical protein